MTDGALFVGWGAPHPGREILALDIYNEAKTFYEGLKKKGDITSFEPFVLALNGGPLRGFLILRGDPLKLANLTVREDFLRLAQKASIAIENLMIVPMFVGDAIPKMFDELRQTATLLVPQHV
jgi:hypothetical protein